MHFCRPVPHARGIAPCAACGAPLAQDMHGGWESYEGHPRAARPTPSIGEQIAASQALESQRLSRDTL